MNIKYLNSLMRSSQMKQIVICRPAMHRDALKCVRRRAVNWYRERRRQNNFSSVPGPRPSERDVRLLIKLNKTNR